MIKASRDHLRSAGETYAEHMRFATTVGILAVGAGLGCLLHALVPGVCQQTCSRTVGQLQELFADRGQLGRVRDETRGVSAFVLLFLLAASTACVVLGIGEGSPMAALLAALSIGFPVAYVASNTELRSD